MAKPADTAPAASPAPTDPAAPARAAQPSAATVPAGYMADAKGRLVPTSMVRDEHLLEDALVRAIHAAATPLSEQLRQFRDSAFDDVDAFLTLLGEKYGVERGGQKGNLTLATFDGSLRLHIAISDRLELGPELQAAKTLIDECLTRWSAGAQPELIALVNDAFSIDKAGKLNVERILALRRLKIDDPTWLRAMEAISHAARVVASKRYLRIYQTGADGKQVQVPLDLAAV